jgi:hypothetical protein
VRKNPSPAQFFLFCYDLENRAVQSLDTQKWLQDRLLPTSDGPEGVPDYRPRLLARVPESTSRGRPVRHAKFGLGKALCEVGTGKDRKIKVDFPGHGLKLLAVRFVEYLDETP